jgi:two-component system chemotaxis response regulator CheB
VDLVPGNVLVAPGGRHLELEAQGSRVVARVATPLQREKYAPSVDRLFASAAKQFGRDLVAVVLTGMGDDGSQGARAVRQAGGLVIAESEETAVIFGMPQQAIRSGAVDRILPLHEIASSILTGIGAGEPTRLRPAVGPQAPKRKST